MSKIPFNHLNLTSNNMGTLKAALRRKVMSKLGFRLHQPSPMQARDWRYSIIASMDDEQFQPSKRLVTLAAEAALAARDISLDELAQREESQENRSATTPRTAVNLWPGEHYRYLAAIVKVLNASAVIEIGTHRGISALAMRHTLPVGGLITTFDVMRWDDFKDTCLTRADMSDGRIAMYADDLCQPELITRHKATLEGADLIFIDGPHDGIIERKIMANLLALNLKQDVVFLFDDIRLWEMLSFWRELPLSKLDVTSFGHWSGTGIAELSAR